LIAKVKEITIANRKIWLALAAALVFGMTVVE
jgi:hypothetical protein